MSDASVTTNNSVQETLHDLLRFLAFWDRHGDENIGGHRGAGDAPKPLRALLGKDGMLGWLRFARKNESRARESVTYLRTAGDVPTFVERLEALRKEWARRLGFGGKDEGQGVLRGGRRTADHERKGMSALLGDTALGGAVDERSIRKTLLYIGEAVCPWDYDRKEPGFTFVNVWTDIETVPGDINSTKVKLTSTINPLRQTWKLSARTRLFNMTGGTIGGGGGDDGSGGATGGIVFGKAGIYLVGEGEPYVGVESDRVINLPFLRGTSMFANANYRSSRKPTVMASVGVQQTVSVGDGLALTFRAGVNSHDGPKRPFFSPVPFGSYF